VRVCLECGKWVPRLKYFFGNQELARRRFEHKFGVYPNESVLGYCFDCERKINFNHKLNAQKKYGFVMSDGGIVMDEKREMSAQERKGRLLFKAVDLLEQLIQEIKKMPEK
jgi:hypothetical protein